MASREDALKALADPDWAGADVEHASRPAMIVQSVRIPPDLFAWVEQEAARLDITPSGVIRRLIDQAARPRDTENLVVVRADELRQNVMRAVEQAIERQPAA